jgi:hypothetical protein
VLEHAQTRFGEAVARPALRTTRGQPRIRALFEHWIAWDAHPGGSPPSSRRRPSSTISRGAVRDRLVRDHRDLLDLVALPEPARQGDRAVWTRSRRSKSWTGPRRSSRSDPGCSPARPEEGTGRRRARHPDRTLDDGPHRCSVRGSRSGFRSTRTVARPHIASATVGDASRATAN